METHPFFYKNFFFFSCHDLLHSFQPLKSSQPTNSSPEGKAKDKEKDNKKTVSPAATPDSDRPFSKVDLRVGRVLSVKKHPNADSLYVEEIDIGEPQPRIVCSGLVKYLQPEEVMGKDVIVVCNLKPARYKTIFARVSSFQLSFW